MIPKSLWDVAPAAIAGSNAMSLRLPRILIEVYAEMLDELGLRAAAEDQTPNDDGPQGGITEEKTHEHFSRNFSGSCARVQFVAIDPMEVYETTRDAFTRMIAGGHLHILDIPCGAGAAGATLLCLAAELREQSVLPRHPLTVRITGGDNSEFARKLMRVLYRKLTPRLKGLGIQVTASVLDWDVEDEEKTSDLISKWLKSANHRAVSAALAVNFSGFLHSKVKDCKNQLGEIMRYVKSQNATMLWVEPATNHALDRLFPGLEKHVFKKVPKVRSVWATAPRQGETLTIHPIQPDGSFMTRCAAMHLETQRPHP